MFFRKFTAPLAPEETFYAVGDIHGMDDILGDMITVIDADAKAQGIDNHRIVMVGDYTDRGPASKAVIDRLMALKAARGDRFICLMGNHDEYVLKFLDEPTKADRWLRLGGTDTLWSFDLRLEEGASDAEKIAVSAEFEAAMGHERIQFFRDLELSFQSGNVFVAHAGAEPDTPLEAQEKRDLLWIRNVTKLRRDGNWVVFGHTVQSAPSAKDGRIAIDTGCVFSGDLTAARIGPGECTFLQVMPEPSFKL